MTRWLVCFLCAVLIGLGSGCGASAGGEREDAGGGLGLPNPVKEVADAGAFQPLDLYIDAPEDADEVSYSIISDQIAQVSFTLDGRRYTYRAAHTEEDISGLYVAFEDEEAGVEADGDGWYASIRIRTVKDSGGALAEFRYGTAAFSLYTGDATDTQTMSRIAVALASVQCPHYAD